MRILGSLILILLTACGEWPEAGGPPMERRAQDWPELLPLDALVNAGQVPQATDDDATRLSNRAAALRNRAAILRGDTGDLDALRARLNR